jgi:16S rRNA (guanine527-N7)-methyltransferase
MEKAEEKLCVITKYFADFSAEQVQQLLLLEPLYKEWNAKINVISRKDEGGLYVKHVLHSLCIAAAFDFKPGMQVLDLGTGGGFPGIPLAIFFPDVQFHLADSIGKKIKVVEAVAGGAGLKNVTAQHIRAEEIKNRKFDVVVSRAVAPLGELWRWSKPLLKTVNEKNTDSAALPVPNGLICLKGGDLSQEIAESGCRPRIMEISEIFDEEAFKEKYILYVPFLKVKS